MCHSGIIPPSEQARVSWLTRVGPAPAISSIMLIQPVGYCRVSTNPNLDPFVPSAARRLVAHGVGERRHVQPVGREVERELEATDVAAIEPLRLRRVAIVTDGGLAGGAFPRHQGITSVRVKRVRVWRGILGGTKCERKMERGASR